MKDPRAKPTLFVPLVGLPAFSIFFFGGLWFASLSGVDSPVLGRARMEEIRDPAKVPQGAYVEVSRLALCAGLQRPDVHAYFRDRDLARCPPATGPTFVSARVCEWPTRLGCGVPGDARKEIASAGFDLPPTRVLVVGESIDDAKRRRMQGFASAAIAVLVYAAMVFVSRRRRKGEPRVLETHAWTLPFEAQEIVERLGKLAGEDRFEIVEQAPGRFVFIQGYSENAARGWGIRKASVFPRRAIITWESSPRHATQVNARIEEDLVWWPTAFSPTMNRLAREAVAATSSRIASVLGVTR